MKKVLIIFALALFGVGASGQNNHFPQSGNVGIGTSETTDKLNVEGNITLGNKTNKEYSIIFRPSDNSWRNGLVGFSSNVPSNDYIGLNTKYGSIRFITNAGHEVLRVTDNERVGIGTDAPQSKLHVAGNILSNDPTTTGDWNTIWQSGYFEGYQKNNAPEQYGWFWGINMNHSSNREDYKYGGQILIKNASTAPTMYFRSRGKDGSGTWAKILHSVGNQRINGGLTVDGVIKTEEIKVEVIAANSITLSSKGQTADFVFSPNYKLRSISEIESFIIENQHLPDIPSAEEMEAEGVNLAEMNKLLLMKIEELTLYVIEKEKEMQEIRNLKMEEEKKRVGLELQMKEVLNILKQTSERLDEIENSKI
jgi:hypothetical protein